MNVLFRLLTMSVACLAPCAPAFGGSVQTIDNRSFEGNLRLAEDGLIWIETSNGVQKLALDKVRVAQFGLLGSEVALPRGWQSEAIGNTQGSCSEKDGQFVMRATAGITPLEQPKVRRSGQIVYRMLRGNGELHARLEHLGGAPNSGIAGLMFRDSIETVSAYVLLGVTPGHKLVLEVRETGWSQVNTKELGPASIPIWLKLRRDDNSVSAWRSSDGKAWQKIEQCKLNLSRDQFPDGGAWQVKSLAGVAIGNPASNLICSAIFTHVSLTAQGLLGVYYADQNFKRFCFSRTDPKVFFHWGYRSPALEMPDDNFSVRWSGNLELKSPGKCSFTYECDGAAKLYLDGKELLPLPSKGRVSKNKITTQEIYLNAAQKYPFQVDYQAGEGAALIRVSCTRGKSEVPLEKAFTYNYDRNSPEEYGDLAGTNLFAGKGIWLRNGSYLAGEIRAADETSTRVRFSGTNELVILNSKIARINFRRLPRRLGVEQTGGHAGLLLKNGDFFESDLRSVKDHVLTVSSVLFGRRTFRLDNPEASAFVLNDFSPLPARFEVKFADGSVLQAVGIKLKGTAVGVQDTTLGEVEAGSNTLVEIQRIPPTGLRAEIK